MLALQVPASNSFVVFLICSLVVNLVSLRDLRMAAVPLLGLHSDLKPHVLAVDDSSLDRKIIERLLTNSSCKVTTAENAHGALELLGLADGQQNFTNTVSDVNMIITDYCMPGMTGYELLKKIKESPTAKEIPVVVVSSENIQTRIEKCLEEGAEEFLLKPLRQSDVKRLKCHLTKDGKPTDEGMLCVGR